MEKMIAINIFINPRCQPCTSKNPCYDYQFQVVAFPYIYNYMLLKPTLISLSLILFAIPDLDKTLERYLRSQKALLNDADYINTEKAVTDFKSGIGAQLHAELKANDKVIARFNTLFHRLCNV